MTRLEFFSMMPSTFVRVQLQLKGVRMAPVNQCQCLSLVWCYKPTASREGASQVIPLPS